MKDGTHRADIRPGIEVDIVLKKDQPSGKLTRGIVKELLTSKPDHPRGIKVRLTSGEVGRVQHIVGEDAWNPKNKLDHPEDDLDESFDNFI
jgi:uncharacterized repeat protein (TIGR03833 family)